MRTISIRQPYATLVVLGEKCIETRSFGERANGWPVLIHASKAMTKSEKELCKQKPFASALKNIDELHLGAIIGSVKIVGCVPTETIKQCKDSGIKLFKNRPEHSWDQEMAFGNYSDGRMGWLLKDPIMFTKPIPALGKLGWWKFDKHVCTGCGCTDDDCRHCIERTGKPCHWVMPGLCSACLIKTTPDYK